MPDFPKKPQKAQKCNRENNVFPRIAVVLCGKSRGFRRGVQGVTSQVCVPRVMQAESECVVAPRRFVAQ